jgi:hypothetical protein
MLLLSDQHILQTSITNEYNIWVHSLLIDTQSIFTLANRSFEKCGTVQIFGNDSDKTNSIPEEIKRKLNSGIACYHSVQKSLSSRLLSKTVRIRIYKTACGSVWVWNWSLTLREEHGLRVFENRVLKRTFGPKRNKMTRDWRKLHNEELHNLYSTPRILSECSSQGGWDRQGM